MVVQIKEGGMPLDIEVQQDAEIGAYKDCWMQTYTGKKFHLLAPSQDEIDIEDIAGPLSKMCRYGGHTKFFYSVAEHSVLIARKAPTPYKLAALLHDASEAYIADIIRPLKPHMPGYYEKEDIVMEAIAKKFGFQYPMPLEIKALDIAILSDERDAVMAKTDDAPGLWGNTSPALGVKITGWAPKTAYLHFMNSFLKYTRG
jgi:hypothetical protein